MLAQLRTAVVLLIVLTVVTGLVYPALDHEALAGLMGRLQERPDLRRSLGHAARRAVEERFSVQGYVARLYELYGLDHLAS